MVPRRHTVTDEAMAGCRQASGAMSRCKWEHPLQSETWSAVDGSSRFGYEGSGGRFHGQTTRRYILQGEWTDWSNLGNEQPRSGTCMRHAGRLRSLHLRSELACLFLFDHAVSLAWGQKAYGTIVQFQYGLQVTYLRWPLHLGESLPPRTSNKKLNSQRAVSTRLSTLQNPLEKRVTSLQELRSTCDFLQTHLQESEFFGFTSNAFLKRSVSLNSRLLCLFSTRKPHAKAIP